MKITIMEPMDGEEDEIIIRCRHLDRPLMDLIYAAKAGVYKITALQDGRYFQVAAEDIFYFEAVDNRVFLYLEQEVYETKRRLYELEESFLGTDFFRASKSCIVNLAKVKSLSPAFNGRFEALMKNGERVIISRQYVPVLKEKLGL
ncbi:MAG: LytTR family transcriptional regulator DNA-binding domain-containing protein [Lachnospiraceae bacterium]|nr:LytTR family transcriptional regulator DNA-binding domain-containing protein [Lachnospiraceae bacterium]MDE6984031.1 LytTR family transcriptional regulator DNA-binding domain-containing protein [Lachnospiraceae bacterium]MDE7029415.1 LytTR family transcriptional regulator DNA-binding domain-containing protein [Lachnospiraceae bacterium]